MFVSIAHAADAATAPAGFDLWSLAPMLVIVVVFYFLLIRPQQKKAKRHRAMLAAIKVGDEVTTNGGIMGRVIGVHDSILHVALNEDNVVKVARDMVYRVHLDEEKDLKPVAQTKTSSKSKKAGGSSRKASKSSSSAAKKRGGKR